LNERKIYYEVNKNNTDVKKGLSYVDTANQLTILKCQDEYTWLKDADAQVLQQSLKNLDSAYQNFFRRVKSKKEDPGFPCFKSKHGNQSIHYPQRFSVVDNHVKAPKVGVIKAVIHRPLEGTPKNITISKTKTGKYFASVQCEIEIIVPERKQSEVGIDVGLKFFAVTSDGEVFDNPRHLLKSEKRLKRLQRRLSKRKKGSSGREKMRKLLAFQHEKVANQRKDFHHKTSRYLIDSYGLVGLENLNVNGMLKNHKLAKHIQDAGWSEFIRQLTYKGIWYGSEVHKINRFYASSHICNVCGVKVEKMSLAVREWDCLNCGTKHDRDGNAAINILNETRAGIARSNAGGDRVSPVKIRQWSMKPEAQML